MNWIVQGDEKEADKVLVRKNGIATYMAKDIPYAAWKLGLVKDPFGYSKHSEQPGGKVMWQTTLNGEKAPEDFTSEKVITRNRFTTSSPAENRCRVDGTVQI